MEFSLKQVVFGTGFLYSLERFVFIAFELRASRTNAHYALVTDPVDRSVVQREMD